MKRITAIIILTMVFQMGISQSLIPFRIGDKWGYSNEKGEVIIKPKYEEAGEFREKITWVKKNGKYGFIDKRGKKKTRFMFDKVKYFGLGKTASVWKNDMKYFIDLNGKKSKPRFGCTGAISGVSKVFQTYRSGEKIGILKYIIIKDEDGNIIEKIDSLPPIWDDLMGNRNGYAAVQKDSLWGVINKEGELVVDYKYEGVEVHSFPFKRNNFFKIRDKGKYGFLNEEGKLVVEPKYRNAEFYSQSKIAKVWVSNEFWGYIDETGKEFFKRNKEESTVEQNANRQ